MILKSADMETGDVYKLLIGCVVPRPIGWVSTVNAGGLANLAPFSFFNAVGVEPPMVAFSPGPKIVRVGNEKRIVPKDTLRNVEVSKEFVVNIVSHSLAEKMNATSGDYAPDVSEFEAAGLTAIASELVTPPRVAESLVSLECRLFQLVKLGDRPLSSTLVIGEVVAFHLAESVYKKGRIDIESLDPIGRLAGNWYCSTRDRFAIARPVVIDDVD